MPTTTLLDALPDKTVLGSLPAGVTGVAYDSRKVAAGALFVAIPGFEIGRASCRERVFSSV